MIRDGILALNLCLLAGCATLVSTPAMEPLPKLHVAPADYGSSVQLNQHLLVKHGASAQELQALLSISAQGVHLVGLSMGMRVLTIDYDGQNMVEQRHPMLPKEVNSERVLSDIMLTYWPLASLQAHLPPGWALSDNGHLRTLTWNNSPVMVIAYSGDDHCGGHADLRNLRYDYEIVIDSDCA